MNKKIVVVGGGTAGAISASYLKKYYGDNVKIILIHPKKNKKIGVGESTTPIILNFLNQINLPISSLLKETNATIKIGIRFENWLLENDTYWHNFKEIPPSAVPEFVSNLNLLNMYDIFHNNFSNGGATYSPEMDRMKKVPFTFEQDKLNVEGNFALHVDAEEFSSFILENINIETLNAEVIDVTVLNNSISNIKLDNGEVISADLFIDCSGFEKTLIKNLDHKWDSFTDTLSVNSAVAGKVYTSQNKSPVTIATAQNNGWIWHIPLKDRYGIGYVFDDNFISFEEIQDHLEKYCNERLNGNLVDVKKLNFKPGCLENNWIGNCVAVGLSSGFVEPLEATNIHTIITQITKLTRHYHLDIDAYNRKVYNKKIRSLQDNIKEVVKIHYLNGKNDTRFWQKVNYCSLDLKEKLQGLAKSLCVEEIVSFDNHPIAGSKLFSADAYTCILHGLKHLKKDKIQEFMQIHEVNLDQVLHIVESKKQIFNKYITQEQLFEILEQK